MAHVLIIYQKALTSMKTKTFVIVQLSKAADENINHRGHREWSPPPD